MGLVALLPVGSSQTGGQTHVLCLGRWTLSHWTTREALTLLNLQCSSTSVHGPGAQ